MSPRAPHNLLLVLLALASLATTALLALVFLAQRPPVAIADPPAARDPAAASVSPDQHPDQPLHLLPDFALTDHLDQPVTRQSLRGRAWVAGFVFTRCQGPCPMVTAAMAALQPRLQALAGPDRLLMVTVTVDPDHDSPAVLREYAARARAHSDFWRFVTAPRQPLWALINDGFRLAVAEDPGNSTSPIAHSTKLVLVDHESRIRDYYDSLDPADRDRLVADVKQLLATTPAATPAKAP